VKPISRAGYDLALEVEVDLFVVPTATTAHKAENIVMEEKRSLNDIFCTSSGGYFGWSWISSFFKEPIAICFPSLLDFFAL
jgi:hypothetical protein